MNEFDKWYQSITIEDRDNKRCMERAFKAGMLAAAEIVRRDPVKPVEQMGFMCSIKLSNFEIANLIKAKAEEL